MNTELMNRYWNKVKMSGPVPPHAPWLQCCWEWLGAHSQGRPSMWVREKHGSERVARVVATNGYPYFLPPAVDVMHKCDNPKCVRPEHLQLGTRKENWQDAITRGRAYRFKRMHGETHASAKLTERDVREIIRMSRSGMSSKTIAQHFPIKARMIRYIVSGQYWKDFQGR